MKGLARQAWGKPSRFGGKGLTTGENYMLQQG